MTGSFERMVGALSQLPGVGRRSAERMAFRLVVRKDTLLRDLGRALSEAADSLCCCSVCGAVTSTGADPCRVCTDPSRDAHLLCVVEDPSDIAVLERSGAFRGRYHALMGKLSPMRGTGVGDLRLDPLVRRVREEGVTELLLALNTDVESDAAAAFIRDLLQGLPVRVCRLGMGLPAGSGVAYADAVTLSRAIAGRQPMPPTGGMSDGKVPASGPEQGAL